MADGVASESLTLNEKSGEILGLLLGNGSLLRHTVRFSNSHMFCVRKYLENMEDVFNKEKNDFSYNLSVPFNSNPKSAEASWKRYLSLKKEISVSISKKGRLYDGVLTVDLNDKSFKNLIVLYKKFLLSKSFASSPFITGFLRGFMAAEGTIIPGKVRKNVPNCIQFPQKGKSLPKLIVYYLDLLGIDARVTVKQREADYYCANITGRQNFKKMSELGLFDLHPEKKRKVEIGLKSYKRNIDRRYVVAKDLLKHLAFGSKTRNEIYEYLGKSKQLVHDLLYCKTALPLRKKLIEKKIVGTHIFWSITPRGIRFLNRLTAE
jgi:hypothetical protein